MTEILHFLERHGYVAVVAAIMGRQACLPVPSNLLLVAAGALAREGKRGPAPILCLSAAAFVLADLAWYEAGRRWGDRTFHFFLAYSPDRLHMTPRGGIKVSCGAIAPRRGHSEFNLTYELPTLVHYPLLGLRGRRLTRWFTCEWVTRQGSTKISAGWWDQEQTGGFGRLKRSSPVGPR